MKQPSQCDRVMEVLQDGHWHGITEIHERAGTMRLNSRVAELRDKRKLWIEHRIIDGEHGYQLVTSTLGSLSESPLSVRPSTGVALQEHAHDDGRGDSESQSLSEREGVEGGVGLTQPRVATGAASRSESDYRQLTVFEAA